jgi:DNA-binding NtrC family response regulator
MDTLNSAANRNHILVVDEDIELALTFQALLQVHDYRASTAGNGVEALKMLKESDVDAVLCDLSMPELTGDLFYNKVGLVRPHLLKRFIFITANADNPLYETFLRRIKAPVLAKPVSFDRLLEKLKSVLGTEAESPK